MKLRKLPTKVKRKRITIVHKFISIDGVRVELPEDACGLIADLRSTTYPTSLVRIYGTNLAQSLIDCGLIKNGNRGARSDKAIPGGLYYATEKLKNNYTELYNKIQNILYGEKENKQTKSRRS